MKGVSVLKDESNLLAYYWVKSICYSQGEYWLGTPVRIVDEGSFYRIDGTHIIDKFKIDSIDIDKDKLTIHMKDQDVVLTVEII